MRRPRRSRKQSTGCVSLLVIGLVILFLDRPLSAALDSPFNPWAHGWGGRPTLVGTWVGTARTPSGQPVALLLDLRRALDSRGRISTCSKCPRIEGSARFCAGGGEGSYEIWGGTDTWSGERFHLNRLSQGDASATFKLGYLYGTWNGQTIEIQSTLEAAGNQAAPPERDVSTPTTLRLVRGDEAAFRAAC